MTTPFLSGDDLNKYVVHAYHSPSFPDLLTWHVVGKRVEAVVSPLKTHASSEILDAQDLGLKEEILASLYFWIKQWQYQNGREDPKATSHSHSYLEAKLRVEQLTNIVHAAVKERYATS
jgi:hypothetical protein